MFLLDDGWFANKYPRSSDHQGLGDWEETVTKLPNGIGKLVKEATDRGIKFGLWIEPEMVNEDSELYRKHPDWAITIPGRNPIRSRNQLLLDFSRKEVRNHVFEQICAVLDQGNIEYVKWDMNRSMADVYASNVTYDYVVGVYDFLEKLTSKYPNILIEGCSGGGGRFDAGMLYYSPQIWCSDNTDPIERLYIQWGFSQFFPAKYFHIFFHDRAAAPELRSRRAAKTRLHSFQNSRGLRPGSCPVVQIYHPIILPEY